MLQVMCTNERESIPNQLKVGDIYWIDERTIFNYDGDTFVYVYGTKDKMKRVGTMLLDHFCNENGDLRIVIN